MMALDTMHDRGFYEARAREHELLEQVIAGETTFTATLDSLLEPMSVKGEKLLSYMQVVGGLAEQQCGGIPERFPHKKNLVQYLKEFGVLMGGIFGGTGAAFGLAALLVPIIPPAILLVPLGFSTSVYGGACLAENQEEANLNELKERRAELLKPVYDIAAALDRDIGLCFVLDYFRDNRPCFEQTYSALGQDERTQVDERLYAFLGAGGIPGMDEIQLEDYLSGLLAPVVEGDA